MVKVVIQNTEIDNFFAFLTYILLNCCVAVNFSVALLLTMAANVLPLLFLEWLPSLPSCALAAAAAVLAMVAIGSSSSSFIAASASAKAINVKK